MGDHFVPPTSTSALHLSEATADLRDFLHYCGAEYARMVVRRDLTDAEVHSAQNSATSTRECSRQLITIQLLVNKLEDTQLGAVAAVQEASVSDRQETHTTTQKEEANLQKEYVIVRSVAIAAAARAEKAEVAAKKWQHHSADLQQEINKFINVCTHNENVIRELIDDTDYLNQKTKRLRQENKKLSDENREQATEIFDLMRKQLEALVSNR